MITLKPEQQADSDRIVQIWTERMFQGHNTGKALIVHDYRLGYGDGVPEGAHLLAHEVGWGKSYPILDAISRFQRKYQGMNGNNPPCDACPNLIVCELSAVRQWASYCENMGLKATVIQGNHQEMPELIQSLNSGPQSRVEFAITNYTKIAQYALHWQDKRFFAVVFDEISRYLANAHGASQRYRACLALDAAYRVGLDGTVLLRWPNRLWPILNVLEPGPFRS